MKRLLRLEKVTCWHYLSRVVLIERMAGAAGLEPVTSAVTGQRSNQLSYAPAWTANLENPAGKVNVEVRKIRAADAKEVGVGNPAEETYRRPNEFTLGCLVRLSISQLPGQLLRQTQRRHHAGWIGNTLAGDIVGGAVVG